MDRTFETPAPITLHIEVGSGAVTVRSAEVTATEVRVVGDDAEQTIVEQRGETVWVLGPRRRGGPFSASGDLTVAVTLPFDSTLSTKLGSADLRATGRYAAARLRSGSGDVTVDELTREAVIESGSGEVELGSSLGDTRITSGSGDVRVGRLGATAVVSTGSGSVTLGSAEHPTVVKSGSGDLRVEQAGIELSLATASGDVSVGIMRRGALKAKAVSGNVSIGVPEGVPVWTDVSTLTGRLRSNLEGRGRPEKGQDHVQIRATTVSGDITLAQR